MLRTILLLAIGAAVGAGAALSLVAHRPPAAGRRRRTSRAALEVFASDGSLLREAAVHGPPGPGGGFVPDFAAVDPRRLLELADRLPPGTHELARQVALQRLADADPRAAIAYAESVPAGTARQVALQAVAAGYGRSDPDAALEWAFSRDDARERALLSALFPVAQRDPAAARAILETHIANPLLRDQAEQMLNAERTLVDGFSIRSAVPMPSLSVSSRTP